ncbi:PREDICTED: tubulin-folding cofactor E [Tarenaya hassleriana]|uniref:tubulin-folding cofactor E n=1 Tax=Tarenaya hassleriana TaxID=28532 RepID=UPI00053C80A4|nr:PREDICTED: tubulin-folding cofactor E [Tarenaya hassleriana]XP_010535914.1 PREDICTED: tubulin-folding cofactor E [Tarenaya hassleriana]
MKTESDFRVGQRVHSINDPRRVGTVMYVGEVQGYSGVWIGVDWDKDGDGKHDGSVNCVRYFQARSDCSASFVRPQNLSHGITLLQALELRYRTTSSKDEEDEMYVLSTRNQRVSVQLLGKEKIQDKLSRFEELTSASLSYLGVSSLGTSSDAGSVIPNLKELDLTGNLISEWKEIGALCEQLRSLTALNLSCNSLAHDNMYLPQLNIRVLVLNNTGVTWTQVEMVGRSLPLLEELHLLGNKIAAVTSPADQSFNSLRLLNLDDNCFSDWGEVLKLSQLRCLEQLYLNNNKLSHIFYPDSDMLLKLFDGHGSLGKSCEPFENLHCLLLGSNNIGDLAAIDSLNSFPKLMDIRLSENPISDPSRGGVPRFVLVARLRNVQVLNGSEVKARERKDSEIRYVRQVMSKCNDNQGEIESLHPRFFELKKLHGIEDESQTVGATGPQNMASGLLSVTLKCVSASIGEKPIITKKFPSSTTVGKLKILCDNFFKLKSLKPKLFLQEEGSPLPASLDDEMANLLDVGISDGSTVLVDLED